MIEHTGPSTSLLIQPLQLKLVAKSKDDITIVKTVTTHQPSLFSGHCPLQHQLIHPSFERSRTPDPPSEDPTSTDHVALSRYPTAPPFTSFTNMLAASGKHDPETRYISSTNKLTKMNFSAKDSLHPTVPNSISLRSHEQTSQFGLKSFFKGKAPKGTALHFYRVSHAFLLCSVPLYLVYPSLLALCVSMSSVVIPFPILFLHPLVHY